MESEMSGKGSAPRPYSVSANEFDDAWERTFGKKTQPTQGETAMKNIPTNHMRVNNGVLQQLWTTEEDVAWLLGRYAMDDVDPVVFIDEPNHTMGEWLATAPHEWRNVKVMTS